MQVKKQQLELDMKQWIGSKLEKEIVKAVYCYSAYLTYVDYCAMLSHSLVSQSVSQSESSDSSNPWIVAHQAPLSLGILQARILEWVAMPSSRGSSQPRD